MNETDSKIAIILSKLPHESLLDFLLTVKKTIQEDNNYWNFLGTCWKAGGSVARQNDWEILFSSNRRNKHKLMKTRERRVWRKLPNKVTAYRAVNSGSEYDTAIAWTLDKKTAEKFSLNGSRKILTKVFDKKDIIAYFDRRKESEIIVQQKNGGATA